jgi:hypothetical protein
VWPSRKKFSLYNYEFNKVLAMRMGICSVLSEDKRLVDRQVGGPAHTGYVFKVQDENNLV